MQDKKSDVAQAQQAEAEKQEAHIWDIKALADFFRKTLHAYKYNENGRLEYSIEADESNSDSLVIAVCRFPNINYGKCPDIEFSLLNRQTLKVTCTGTTDAQSLDFMIKMLAAALANAGRPLFVTLKGKDAAAEEIMANACKKYGLTVVSAPKDQKKPETPKETPGTSKNEALNDAAAAASLRIPSAAGM